MVDASGKCPRCDTPVAKVVGGVVAIKPGIEFATCNSCAAWLLRTPGALWSLEPNSEAADVAWTTGEHVLRIH